MREIHESRVGTYHPNPKQDVSWTVNDTRGYIDGGPDCEECGSENLSFAYICLDGGDSLCSRCAEKEGIEIVPCDCE